VTTDVLAPVNGEFQRMRVTWMRRAPADARRSSEGQAMPGLLRLRRFKSPKEKNLELRRTFARTC